MRFPLLAALAAVLLVAAPVDSWGQGTTIRRAMHIWGGPLHREYLGCLNCDRLDVSSVFNTYGAMGWDNEYANHSRFARYRAPHDRYSACDPYAAEPPILKDTSLTTYGVLSVSTTRADSICGPKGTPTICQVLKATCAKANP
ncbi:MAG: hypothetical protein LCH56_09895 [Proteobacteria bacterium]|nr:hypothetical protein [Pseudomonadota bacterium]